MNSPFPEYIEYTLVLEVGVWKQTSYFNYDVRKPVYEGTKVYKDVSGRMRACTKCNPYYLYTNDNEQIHFNINTYIDFITLHNKPIVSESEKRLPLPINGTKYKII